MDTKGTGETFLRRAIRAPGLGRAKLARLPQVPQGTITQFLARKTHLDALNVERLLDFFGMELALRPKPPAAIPEPKWPPAVPPVTPRIPGPRARPRERARGAAQPAPARFQ